MPRKVTDYVPHWGEAEKPPAKPAGPLPPSDPAWNAASEAPPGREEEPRRATDYPQVPKMRTVFRAHAPTVWRRRGAPPPRIERPAEEEPFGNDPSLKRDLPAQAGRFRSGGVPPEYVGGSASHSMKRAECVRCGRRTDPENMNHQHQCIDCQREMQSEELSMGKDLLGRPVIEDIEEGLSVNGSMGLGGISAQGFDVQNQGIAKRRPGEGAKDNGGRAQAQELDSYDQPQYVEFPRSRRFDIMRAEAREVKPNFWAYRPGEEEPPIEPDARMYHRSNHPDPLPPISDMAIELYPDLFKGYVKKGDVWMDPKVKDDRYGPTGQIPVLQRKHPKIDPTKVDGIAGYDFTRDNPRIIQALGGEDDPMEFDIDLDEAMKDDDLEKASRKEHEEHPWTTMKQAMQIAKDHEKIGK